jgi:hypothetical protein
MIITLKQWEFGEATRSEFFGQFTNPSIYRWIEERIPKIWIKEDPDIYLSSVVSFLLDQVGQEDIVEQFHEMIDIEKWKDATEGQNLEIQDCLQIFIEACQRLVLLEDIVLKVLNGISEKTVEKIIKEYCNDSLCFSDVDQRKLLNEMEKLLLEKEGGRAK